MKKCVVFCLIVSLMGCASISVIELLPDKYQPKPDNYFMPILLEKPARKYKAIAVITAESEDYSFETLAKKLREKARKIGADAILALQNQSDTATVGFGSVAGGFGGLFIGSSQIRRLTGTAIVFEE